MKHRLTIPALDLSRFLAGVVTAGWLLNTLPLLFAQTTNVIPANWAYPLSARDLAAPGFSGRIHQARQNASLSATVARANAQLNGTLIDPQTGQPYLNLAVTTTNDVVSSGTWLGLPVQPGGSFQETNVINYSVDTAGQPGDLGNFNSGTGYVDQNFPGLPGANDTTFTTYANLGNLAMEEIAFLELQAGTYVFGVLGDDSFELAFHPNDSRDLFRVAVADFGSNRGATETTAYVRIEADGLYAVRLLHAQYQDSPPAELEFYTVDPNDPNTRMLVNDRTQPNAVKAWRALVTPARPYVQSVSPTAGATGVFPTNAIEAVLVNLGTNTPVLKVNGAAVKPVSVATGNETKLTYQPAAPFPGGAVVQVAIEYAGAQGAWSFVTRTGIKALMIVGGTATASDNWMASRLASNYGLDVLVKTDSAVTTNEAAGCVLIVNSATVNSGNVASKNFEELPIPILNGEQANIDDFLFGAAGGNIDISQVEIVDGSHPIAAGLTNGTYTIYNAGVVNQVHTGNPDPAVTVVGVNPGNQQTLIFAVEEGTTILDFPHPARRVHLGIVGNDGGTRFNENGQKLFDAAVRWLLKLPAESLKFKPPTVANGQVTLSWTGTGQLEEAATVTGPWSNSTNQSNPQTVTATGSKFYRLRP
jgi:hypothetical protein